MSYANQSNGHDQRAFPGVAMATVTNNEDPEELGRVKVTYPWRDIDDESPWAPIATPMAGEEAGAYFIPDVDDQVLVAFKFGDVTAPVVIGSLWDDQRRPPVTNDDDNAVRAIHSRTGHQLTMDDDETAGQIRIETAGGHEITLDDEGGNEAIAITDSTDTNRIEFDATAASLAIESDGKLTIDAGSINISGQGNISIESGGVIRLDGSLIQLN